MENNKTEKLKEEIKEKRKEDILLNEALASIRQIHNKFYLEFLSLIGKEVIVKDYLGNEHKGILMFFDKNLSNVILKISKEIIILRNISSIKAKIK